MKDDLPKIRITDVESPEDITSLARGSHQGHQPSGLSRALHSTAPPRRNATIPLYERVGALRERRRLAVGALAVLLGLLVAALFMLWEWRYASGVTYSHWGQLGKAAGDDYDEGAYVLSAQLLLHGFALFSQVFSAQPAFFLPSLALAVRAIPDPLAAAHLYEAACGVLTLIAVFLLAATAYRTLAGPLAAALLALSPGFLLYAHAVESEMPMLAFCALSVLAAQVYYLRGGRLAAALAGLLLMVGTEMKLLSAVVVVPLALLLAGGLWRRYRSGRTWRAPLLDGGAFLAALIGPALLVLLLVAPADQWNQAITFHLRSGRVSTAVLPPSMGANVDALKTFLGYDPGLLIVAAAGCVVAISAALIGVMGSRKEGGAADWRRAYLPLVYLLWALSTGLFLLRYHPLFQHQFVPLLPPLALLGAGLLTSTPIWRRASVAGAGGRMRYTPTNGPGSRHGPGGRAVDSSRALTNGQARPRPARFAVGAPLWRGRSRAIATALATVALILYAGVFWRDTGALDGHLFKPIDAPARAALIRLLDRATRPGDFVVCDDPNVALGAHRLVPPALGDPSRVRAASGYLTVAQVEAATIRYHVAAIVASRPMFTLYMPAYLTWAAARYRRVPTSLPGVQVYLRR